MCIFRDYYRCTHQKSYQCPAKRTVQRLDTNPSTFNVTYINHHTCHLSSTAPSSAPLLPPDLLPSSCAANHLTTAAASNSGYGWPPLSLGFGAQGSCSNAMTSGDRGAKYGVAQMADVMFNSRGSTVNNNSFMDMIFPADAKDD